MLKHKEKHTDEVVCHFKLSDSKMASKTTSGSGFGCHICIVLSASIRVHLSRVIAFMATAITSLIVTVRWKMCEEYS